MLTMYFAFQPELDIYPVIYITQKSKCEDANKKYLNYNNYRQLAFQPKTESYPIYCV